MPELPEVETTLRGLSPHLTGQVVADVTIRNGQLRWPIPQNLSQLLRGQTVRNVQRRAKYLLLGFDHGTLILHLGMSGSLRILTTTITAEKHEHFDLILANGTLMRLRDPRRFGAVLWHSGAVSEHPLLAKLGPEPLRAEFDTEHLFRATRGRSAALKLVIMDSQVVVGVGNIYANEALFRAGIKPQLAAGKLSRVRCEKLVAEIRATLSEAILLGGSSLRDYVDSDGKQGYFQQHYWVYGRANEACRRCGATIKQVKQGQRSSFYCPVCQR
ncbi:MAG: bifunctional DNA-formamidopyrimidine glycosylase/DNA-(apurinic or apyrimidinic site) lyase [Gallionellaceae bacterium]|jgi:formamidopyrimidine-DNA glycosylase